MLPVRFRSVAVRLLLLPVLGVAACQSGPPIRLNPVKAQYAPMAQRRVARAMPAAPAPVLSTRQAAAAGKSCTSPVLQGMTGERKDELFRQFAAAEGQPAGSEAAGSRAAGASPAGASPAACQPAGR